jgi:hypothetical protein
MFVAGDVSNIEINLYSLITATSDILVIDY